MPLRQTEEHRSEANQRALVLYGMDDARENHKSEMKKVPSLARKCHIGFFSSSKAANSDCEGNLQDLAKEDLRAVHRGERGTGVQAVHQLAKDH